MFKALFFRLLLLSCTIGVLSETNILVAHYQRLLHSQHRRYKRNPGYYNEQRRFLPQNPQDVLDLFIYAPAKHSYKTIGSSIHFDCELTEGNSATWSRENGVRFSQFTETKKLTNRNIYRIDINNLDVTDSGKYICAANTGNPVDVESVYLEVTGSGSLPENEPYQPSYPQDQPSYTQDQQSYPQDQPSYPHNQPSYPQNQPSYPQDQPSYHHNQPSYPQDYPNQQTEYPTNEADEEQRQQLLYEQELARHREQQVSRERIEDDRRRLLEDDRYKHVADDRRSDDDDKEHSQATHDERQSLHEEDQTHHNFEDDQERWNQNQQNTEEQYQNGDFESDHQSTRDHTSHHDQSQDIYSDTRIEPEHPYYNPQQQQNDDRAQETEDQINNNQDRSNEHKDADEQNQQSSYYEEAAYANHENEQEDEIQNKDKDKESNHANTEGSSQPDAIYTDYIYDYVMEE